MKILCRCFVFVFVLIIFGCSNPLNSNDHNDYNGVMALDFLVSKIVCTGYQNKVVGSISFSRDYYFQFGYRIINEISGAKYPKLFVLPSAYLTEEDYLNVISNGPFIEVYSPIKGKNSIVYGSRNQAVGHFGRTGKLNVTITLGIDTVNEVVYEVMLFFQKSV